MAQPIRFSQAILGISCIEIGIMYILKTEAVNIAGNDATNQNYFHRESKHMHIVVVWVITP
jgi:hypothetical protein